MFKRTSGRSYDELRPVKITTNFLNKIPGSVLIEQGNTKILITSTIQDSVPSFLRDTGTGWITAEYSMLPRSAETRIPRERNKVSGRTYEIQRLIGRSIRQAFDIKKFGEKTIIVDCDVLQADGGTRTASITGGFVSVYHSMAQMLKTGEIEAIPLKNFVSAVSVGIVNGEMLLDLEYNEDSVADVDMNVVMTNDAKIIEVQATAEGKSFSSEDLNKLLKLSEKGIKELIEKQRDALSLTLAM